MKRFLVRYVEGAVHENNFWNEDPNNISPCLDGIFILTEEEIEMLGEGKSDDIDVGEYGVFRFSEENLSIVSEDEGEISLFESWMPNGGGFPWKYYLIDVRVEGVIQMAFDNLHNNLENVVEGSTPDDVIQKSLEEVDLKGRWKNIYEEYIRYFDVVDEDTIKWILGMRKRYERQEEEREQEKIKEEEQRKKRRVWKNMNSLERIRIMDDKKLKSKWDIMMWGQESLSKKQIEEINKNRRPLRKREKVDNNE